MYTSGDRHRNTLLGTEPAAVKKRVRIPERTRLVEQPVSTMMNLFDVIMAPDRPHTAGLGASSPLQLAESALPVGLGEDSCPVPSIVIGVALAWPKNGRLEPGTRVAARQHSRGNPGLDSLLKNAVMIRVSG